MNPKQFMRRWIEGIKNITPAQQLHAEMMGYIGNIVGMLFALIFLLYNGMWYFTIFLLFTTFLQVIAYISTRQKYEATVKFMDMMGQNESKSIDDSEELLNKLSK